MAMFKKIYNFIAQKATLNVAAILFATLALLTSVLDVLQGRNKMMGDVLTSHYNNYTIFKQSFLHLWQHQNLYIHYNEVHFDLYKYAPTFALLMMPFAYLPDIVGLSLWNILNALVLWYGIRSLPFSLSIRTRMSWFVLLELMTAVQNDQSNALLAGLLLLAYSDLERDNMPRATFLLSIATYIKIFPIVAFIWVLYYPNRWRGVAWSAFHITWLAFVPMLFVGWSQLLWQYQNWWVMLAQDYSDSSGLSVMAWFQTWFGVVAKKEILAIGASIFIILGLLYPYFEIKKYRIGMVAATLIWMVIFNHKAESPTFVIAIIGAALWYFTKAKPSTFDTILIVSAFIFTSLSPTDLFPRSLRESLVIPFVLKAVPCIWIWIKIGIEIMLLKNNTSEIETLDLVE